ncbi:signal peptidase I [Streptomyces sp. NPDC054802]
MGSGRPGRGLRIAGWVLTPLGVLLCAGALLTLRSEYGSVTMANQSMQPTYGIGDRVVFETLDDGRVRRGDLVVYSVPDRYRGQPVLHRVIGVGGDRVVGGTDGGPLSLNGEPLPEPYVWQGDAVGGMPFDVTVPEGRLFLLGDDRGNSRDSRSFQDEHGGGTVASTSVHGRVLDDVTVPVVLGLITALGVVAGLTGAGLGLASGLTGRRRPVPPSDAVVLGSQERLTGTGP